MLIIAEVGQVLVCEQVRLGIGRVHVVVRYALQHLHKGLHFRLTVLEAGQCNAHCAIVLTHQVDAVARVCEIYAL